MKRELLKNGWGFRGLFMEITLIVLNIILVMILVGILTNGFKSSTASDESASEREIHMASNIE